MADSASVVSAQISVARSEAHSLAAPSVAHSEPGLRAPSSRRSNVDGRRRQLPKKSHSTTSLDSNEKKEERRGVAPSAAARSPAAGSSSRRGSLTKSMSLSAMNASGSDHHQHQSSRLLQKSRSRRQIASTTSSHNGDQGHRSSKSMTHRRKQSRSENLMNDSSNREEEKTVASTSASRSGRRTTSAEMGNSSNRDQPRRHRSSKNANTDEEKRRRSRSKSVNGRRKSDRSTKRSSETSASLASADRDAKKREKRSSKSDALKSPSSSHGKPQSQHRSSGSSGRKPSARPSAEGEETRSTPGHRSRRRSVSAGPSASRRKSRSVKPSTSNNRIPRASETPMSSLSENTHRGRLSSPQRGTPGKSMHQSIGAINTDLSIMKQTSRPLPRRELAKRKSVRAPGWLSERGHQSTSIMDHSNATEGGGRGRRGTRAIQEHDLLQMSVSELNHDVQVIPSDPLTLSPTSANTDPQRIYELGLLSPAHLDRQPSANAAAPVVAAPKEIVKVQFVQSGGKVVPVKSPKDHFPVDPSATPRSTAKKKLQNLLAFGMTPKLKASSLFSRYQTFRDDDHSGHHRSSPAEDSASPSSPNSNANLDPKISSWSEVDAAIPMLHL